MWARTPSWAIARVQFQLVVNFPIRPSSTRKSANPDALQRDLPVGNAHVSEPAAVRAREAEFKRDATRQLMQRLSASSVSARSGNPTRRASPKLWRSCFRRPSWPSGGSMMSESQGHPSIRVSWIEPGNPSRSVWSWDTSSATSVSLSYCRAGGTGLIAEPLGCAHSAAQPVHALHHDSGAHGDRQLIRAPHILTDEDHAGVSVLHVGVQ